MIRPRKPVLNAVIAIARVESLDAHPRGPTAAGLGQVSKQDAVVGDNDCAGRRALLRSAPPQTLPRWTIGLVAKLDEGELVGAVDPNEEL